MTESAAPAAPFSERVARTRERVLTAAGQCFAERGFAKSTVEEIASRAGVSKGIVYVHFRGKEDLLEKVLAVTLERWHREVWSAVESEASSALEGIEVFHRRSFDFARRHPVLRTILARDSRLLLTPDHETPRRAMERWRRSLTSLVERGVEAGEIRSDLETEQLVDVLRLHHLAFLDRLYTTTSLDVTKRGLLDTSVEVLLAGIASA